MTADCIQQSTDGFGRHQRRGAATQKNTGDDPVGHQLRLLPDRPRKARDKPLFIDFMMADMAVEIAVRAFRQAKRPMQIDPETGIIGTGTDRWRGCFHVRT